VAVGDKMTFRAGAKATVSKVIPDDQMPRTEDGRPLDVMLNPLSLVSRANPATQHEIRLGKIARAMGKNLKVPAYLPKGENWNDFIDNLEAEHGVQSEERVFDPMTNRFLAQPVTVGDAFLNKLHHVSHGKMSGRGGGGYDNNQQPSRGPGDNAKAKRFSSLENYAALSAGAYALLRENASLRGQKNDEFWRAMRAGKPLPKLGTPFVWNKFRALLSGAGMATREVGEGRYRLAPFTDEDLEREKPVDVENGELVHMKTLEPVRGGLFDPRSGTGEKWGRIQLPRPVVNPAMEDSVRVLLGLTKSQLEDVLAGRAHLEEFTEI
jgi:DNA-directed RNA polymerase subunit beta